MPSFLDLVSNLKAAKRSWATTRPPSPSKEEIAAILRQHPPLPWVEIIDLIPEGKASRMRAVLEHSHKVGRTMYYKVKEDV
jgi:hypothetical protein